MAGMKYRVNTTKLQVGWDAIDRTLQMATKYVLVLLFLI